jgi:DNA-binding transcriptional MerR regulator
MSSELLTVNQLAVQLGVTPRTIRFYEAKGLLSPQRAGTTRVFTKRDRARLLLILRGKRLGFSLTEIAEYFALYDADRTQRGQVLLLMEKVRERIRTLEAQRCDLEQTINELHDIEDQAVAALRLTNGGTP